ncbi:Fic/DOC family N-terminal domain-containing protein [Phenylobacterium sp.]|uniref:Fic/DOC family N-terminal domain-containing protein n=1 Tax=Phenylobacterium sp. TaxID=1871053 RepID=UPI004035D636
METREVLRELSHAHRHLAELKGRAAAIPNQAILIDTLSLQEAKASSEIENIVTTQDEIFQASLFLDGPASPTRRASATTRPGTPPVLVGQFAFSTSLIAARPQGPASI